MIAYDALGAAEAVRYKYEKSTGFWVWASFKTLVGIFSQTAGPACESRTNPVTFAFRTFQAGSSGAGLPGVGGRRAVGHRGRGRG